MTNVVNFEIKEDDIKKEETKDEYLYVAGYFSKGPNKGKKVAIEVRNTRILNPLEPIFDAYPDIDCLIASKSQTKARKYFKKLVS